MTQLRFALAQIDTCVGALDANAAKVLDYSRKAAAGNAQVVVFPEMTLTGYPIEDLALRRTFRQAAWDKANELATQLNDDGLGDLFVVVGTVGTDRKTSKPRNRLVVLHQGVVWAGYDKHFLPNYGVFDEFRIFSAGDRSVTLDVDGATIGVAICEDIWQDGGPVADLATKNIDLLLTINGSPYEEGKTNTRFELAQRRAAEVNAPVIYLNQVGGQDDLVFDGGSFVVDADGTLIERSPMFMENLTFWDFDSAAEHQAKAEIVPELDPDEEVYTACVLGLKDYMAKNHFTGVTLGLSGGIDSALVAAMAADACGGENVWGISMPSMYSSDGSKDDAADLASNIGAHYEVQPIEPLFNAYQQQLDLDGVSAENLQARIRGVIVMASSNSRGLLAVATGNKSELACGYSTIYGDAVGGYAPIKDLLKTRVWEISRWRNKAAAAGVGIGGLKIVGNEDGNTGIPLKDGVMIPVLLHREGTLGRVAPRAEGLRLPARIRAARQGARRIHRARARPRRPVSRRLRPGHRRHRDAIGGPRRMEAPPIPAGTEGHGPRVRPRPPTARHQRIQGINIYCSRQREQVIPLRRYQ